MIETKKE
jgi:hypothetical protein